MTSAPRTTARLLLGGALVLAGPSRGARALAREVDLPREGDDHRVTGRGHRAALEVARTGSEGVRGV